MRISSDAGPVNCEATGSANQQPDSARQKRPGDVDKPGADEFAEAFRLCVTACRGSDTISEQAFDHEVQTQQVRQGMAINLETVRFRHQGTEALDREMGFEPSVGPWRFNPESNIGIASLVA